MNILSKKLNINPKKLKSYKLQADYGFTLVELLVLSAIIALLASLMLTNYRGGSQKLAERRSLQIIAQSVRSAQVKALGAEVACVPVPPNTIYYGVHFDISSREILVFATCDDNQYDAGEEILGETRELGDGVLITNLFSPGATAVLDILFEPPDPTITFNPGVGPATITITGGRSVTAGKGGSVDIN